MTRAPSAASAPPRSSRSSRSAILPLLRSLLRSPRAPSPPKSSLAASSPRGAVDARERRAGVSGDARAARGRHIRRFLRRREKGPVLSRGARGATERRRAPAFPDGPRLALVTRRFLGLASRSRSRDATKNRRFSENLGRFFRPFAFPERRTGVYFAPTRVERREIFDSKTGVYFPLMSTHFDPVSEAHDPPRLGVDRTTTRSVRF